VKHLAIAGLLSLSLIVACGADASDIPPTGAITKVIFDDANNIIYMVEGEGVRCVVADLYQAGGIDCDWDER
jgi:hypothetical protein